MTRENPSAAELIERFKKSGGSLVVLKDMLAAIRQLESGQGVSNRDAKAELRRRFKMRVN